VSVGCLWGRPGMGTCGIFVGLIRGLRRPQSCGITCRSRCGMGAVSVGAAGAGAIAGISPSLRT
jgi:hypothetical protein